MDATASLPSSYLESLGRLSLLAGWTQLKAVTPRGRPVRRAMPISWPYRDLRPQLMEAGRLVPMELAERRVLALINPGLDPAAISTTTGIFAGMQLILPGEWAPNHRHTPAAARIVVEGEGAYTAVNGEKLIMRAGDVILTPPHYWHEHGHEGREPVVWMDILDHPVAVPLETSFAVLGNRSPSLSNAPDRSESHFANAGLVPYRAVTTPPDRYPMMRFTQARTRESLLALASVADRTDPVHLMYVNPESGASALETLCFSVRLLRPGEEVRPATTSASHVFHVFEGAGETEVDGECMAWDVHDTIAVPTFARIVHRNRSATRDAILFQVDDAPLQHKLGFFATLKEDLS